MEANQDMAMQARLSAHNTEAMTRDMNDMNVDMKEIARKTKMETISMRIITLVTLFFLPGTIISVRIFTSLLRLQW